MGSCFSTTKVSGSNSNTHSTTAAATTTTATNNRRSSAAAATASAAAGGPRKQESSHNNHHQKGRENHKSQQQKPSQQNLKNSSKRPSGVIPCGKRTDFGYDKDFEQRYTIGKLLGHGQFGYTYVAIDKSNADRVAVKKIDKSKVRFLATFFVL